MNAMNNNTAVSTMTTITAMLTAHHTVTALMGEMVKIEVIDRYDNRFSFLLNGNVVINSRPVRTGIELEYALMKDWGDVLIGEWMTLRFPQWAMNIL